MRWHWPCWSGFWARVRARAEQVLGSLCGDLPPAPARCQFPAMSSRPASSARRFCGFVLTACAPGLLSFRETKLPGLGSFRASPPAQLLKRSRWVLSAPAGSAGPRVPPPPQEDLLGLHRACNLGSEIGRAQSSMPSPRPVPVVHAGWSCHHVDQALRTKAAPRTVTPCGEWAPPTPWRGSPGRPGGSRWSSARSVGVGHQVEPRRCHHGPSLNAGSTRGP